jgi:hypothetical protein
MDNSYLKYIKYKIKYNNLKKIISGTIEAKSSKINDIIPEKESGFNRTMLFGISNVEEELNFINSTDSDIVLLNEKKNYSNYKLLTEKLNLKNHNIEIDYNKYFGNAIFSEYKIENSESIKIGISCVLLLSKIKIFNQEILFLTTSIDNTDYIKIIAKIIDEYKKINKYIIFGAEIENEYSSLNLVPIKNSLINLELNNPTLTNLFFVSEDFLLDFDIKISVIKSYNYPIIIDFKYINTIIKKFESHLQFIFNSILYSNSIFKDNYIIYYRNKALRGHLYFDDKFYRFTNYKIYLKDKSSNKDSFAKLNITLNKLIDVICEQKRYILPIFNFFNKVIDNRDEILKNCYENVCKFIKDNNNFTKSEVNEFNLDNIDNIKQIINKYYKKEYNFDNKIIKINLFGFDVLEVILVDDIKDDEYNYLLKDKIGIIKLDTPTIEFMKNRIYNNNTLLHKTELTIENSKEINPDLIQEFFWSEFNSNIQPEYIIAQKVKLEELSSKETTCNIQDILYKYTEKFNNLIKTLINQDQSLINQEQSWIDLNTNKSICKKDNTPYKITEVIDCIDSAFLNAPENEDDFNVLRASNYLDLLFNTGIDIYNGDIEKDLKISYYQSTTLDGSIFFDNYFNVLFPVLLNIKIPKGNKVLILGGNFGQPTQLEVLLDKNCTLEYKSHSYKKVISNWKREYLYTLVINYEYNKK